MDISLSSQQLTDLIQLIYSKLPAQPKTAWYSGIPHLLGMVSTTFGGAAVTGLSLAASVANSNALIAAGATAVAAATSPLFFLYCPLGIAGILIMVAGPAVVDNHLDPKIKWREQEKVKNAKIVHLELKGEEIKALERALTGKRRLSTPLLEVPVITVLDCLSQTLANQQKYCTGIASLLDKNGIFGRKNHRAPENVVKLTLEYADEVPIENIVIPSVKCRN